MEKKKKDIFHTFSCKLDKLIGVPYFFKCTQPWEGRKKAT